MHILLLFENFQLLVANHNKVVYLECCFLNSLSRIAVGSYELMSKEHKNHERS